MNKPNLVLAFYPQWRDVDFRGGTRNSHTTMRTLRDDANNDTGLGLIAAAHNWRELGPGWCECPPADELMEVFFRDSKSGAQGWMCTRCREMTQTG
jgi:hypothetical protein